MVVGVTDCWPLVDLAPVHPLLAVHEVLLVELHVINEEEPDTMLVGDAPIVTVGVLVPPPETGGSSILLREMMSSSYQV